METDVHKVRTLCSEWQLERPKYEPFARNDSWSAQSTNPLLKCAYRHRRLTRASPKSEPVVERHRRQPKVRPKYEPFTQSLSRSDQSVNPLLKMLAGALKV